MLLLVLLAVPIVVGVTAFFLGKKRITPLELALQVGIVGALIVGGYYLTRWGGLQDYELWNGRIASKPSGTSSCCHSYDCNCRTECTGAGSDQTCDQKCDTCYEHDYDYFHSAYTTNGERVYHSACDRTTPAAWSRISIGEPTVVEHRYTNYIKADPDEFIRPSDGRFAATVPGYPSIVSGWRARRFLFIGVPPPSLDLDYKLDELNADLGSRKQVNAIVIVVREADPAYAGAVAAAWLGGKKNDVILVIGVPEFPTIAWTRVLAWNAASGGEDEFKGGLAARVESLGTFDGDAVLAILREDIDRSYQRRSFSEFEYLMARARPPGWAVAVLFALGLGLSALLQRRFWRNARRMRGDAPHVRVQRNVARLRGWWRSRTDRAEPGAPETKRTSDTTPSEQDLRRAQEFPGLHGLAVAEDLPSGSEIERPLVSIQTIDSIVPIKGADRIVRASVGGRTVVVEKGAFIVGDRCVYFEPGCVLPAGRRWTKFMRRFDYRVGRRDVRGVSSVGLALPLSIFDEADAQDGDLQARLGVTAGKPS